MVESAATQLIGLYDFQLGTLSSLIVDSTMAKLDASFKLCGKVRLSIQQFIMEPLQIPTTPSGITMSLLG